MDEQVKQLKNYMNESNNTVAITGAGISYLYGMRRFKQAAGEAGWQRKITAEYVKDHPEEVYALFKDAFLDAIFEKGPSKVHYQLADLEKNHRIKGIVTQNLDCLHNIAGSKNVAAFAGSFADNVCIDCGAQYHDLGAWHEGEMPKCPKCGGYLLPAFFSRLSQGPGAGGIDTDEYMEQARDMIAEADLLLVIGTTGFHSDAYLSKMKPTAKIVQINPGSTIFDQMAVLNIKRDAMEVLEELMTQ